MIIAKKHPNILEGTSLDNALKREGIATLIIAGLISNGCVRDSCLTALKNRYNVILLGNVHGTFYSNGKRVVEGINRETEEAGVCVCLIEELSKKCVQ